MGYSMYRHHKKSGNKAMITAQGQVTDITRLHIPYFYAMGLWCTHVVWEIYSHRCSSEHLHKWHACWEIICCSLIPYLILTTESQVVLGLGPRTENHHVCFMPSPENVGHELGPCAAYVNFQVWIICSTNPQTLMGEHGRTFHSP